MKENKGKAGGTGVRTEGNIRRKGRRSETKEDVQAVNKKLFTNISFKKERLHGYKPIN